MIPGRMCTILLIYCYCDTSSISSIHIILEMKKNFLVLIMATIVFLIVKSQTTVKPPKYAPDFMFQVCGKHLAALLSFVCESRYNTPIPGRTQRHLRSIDEVDPNTSESEDDPPSTETSTQTEEPTGVLSIILPREDAQSFLSFRRRKKRGVYDECCKKACAYRELRFYCAT